MSGINKFIVLIIIGLIICPFSVTAQNGARQIQPNIKKNGLNGKNIVNENNTLPRPVLAVSPREMDIGTIGSGETGSGVFALKNMVPGIMNWSTGGVEGWKIPENQKLSSTVVDDADYLRIEVHVLVSEQTVNLSKSRALFYPVEIKMTAGNGKLVCRKDLSAGQHRESIKITSAGGNRTIFITFKVVSSKELAQINLNPERMDMGSVLQGKSVSKKIRLTNKGKEILKWSVAEQKQKRTDVQIGVFKQGKYISFVNEEIRGSGTYLPSAYLKESMEIIGKWAENDGYPSSAASTNSLKFRFTGTGLILYYATYPDAGNLTVYLDEKLINEHDWFADQKEKGELYELS